MTTKQSKGHTERYWEAGYTVAGAAPITVEHYARSADVAASLAVAAAKEATGPARQLGIAVDVSAWVQPWRTWDVTEKDDLETVEVITVTRLDPETAQMNYEDRRPRGVPEGKRL